MSSGSDRRIQDPEVFDAWNSYLAMLYILDKFDLTMPDRYSYNEFREYWRKCAKQSIEKIVDLVS